VTNSVHLTSPHPAKAAKVEVFPGGLGVGESFFAPGEKSAVIDYSTNSTDNHELSDSFR
jgi:hypothetical protein